MRGAPAIRSSDEEKEPEITDRRDLRYYFENMCRTTMYSSPMDFSKNKLFITEQIVNGVTYYVAGFHESLIKSTPEIEIVRSTDRDAIESFVSEYNDMRTTATALVGSQDPIKGMMKRNRGERKEPLFRHERKRKARVILKGFFSLAKAFKRDVQEPELSDPYETTKNYFKRKKKTTTS